MSKKALPLFIIFLFLFTLIPMMPHVAPTITTYRTSFSIYNSQSGYASLSNAVWNTVWSGTVGGGAGTTYCRREAYQSGPNYGIFRGFVVFDTSSLPDNAVVTGISLAYTEGMKYGSSRIYCQKDFNAKQVIDTADYDKANFSTNLFSIYETATGAQNVSFTTVVNVVSLTSYSTYVMRDAYDYNNTAPGTSTAYGFCITTASTVKLWVTYTITTNLPPLITNTTPENCTISGDTILGIYESVVSSLTCTINDPEGNHMNLTYRSNSSGSWVNLNWDNGTTNATVTRSIPTNTFSCNNKTCWYSINVTDNHSAWKNTTIKFYELRPPSTNFSLVNNTVNVTGSYTSVYNATGWHIALNFHGILTPIHLSDIKMNCTGTLTETQNGTGYWVVSNHAGNVSTIHLIENIGYAVGTHVIIYNSTGAWVYANYTSYLQMLLNLINATGTLQGSWRNATVGYTNSSLIIRPDGDGTYSEWNGDLIGASYPYQAVEDVVPDDTTSYVNDSSIYTSPHTMTFTISPPSSPSGAIINNVTLYSRMSDKGTKDPAWPTENRTTDEFNFYLYNSSNGLQGPNWFTIGSWNHQTYPAFEDFNDTFTTNLMGNPWIWSDLSDMEIGLQGEGILSYITCTQLYAVVNYKIPIIQKAWVVWGNSSGNLTPLHLLEIILNATGSHTVIQNSTGYWVTAQYTGNGTGPGGNGTYIVTIHLNSTDGLTFDTSWTGDINISHQNNITMNVSTAMNIFANIAIGGVMNVIFDTAQFGLVILLIMTLVFIILGITIKDHLAGSLFLISSGIFMLDLMISILAMFSGLWWFTSPSFVIFAFLLMWYGYDRLKRRTKARR